MIEGWTVVDSGILGGGGLLAFFIRQWVQQIGSRLDEVVRNLEKIAQDIHYHRVRATETVARLDERLQAVERAVDRKP